MVGPVVAGGVEPVVEEVVVVVVGVLVVLGAPVVVVDPGVEDVEPVVEVVVELEPVAVEFGEPPREDGVVEDEVVVLVGVELATRPLWFSSDSTCCWTAATCEATAAGVPPAPSSGRAFSFCSACWSLVRSAREGCDLRVITI